MAFFIAGAKTGGSTRYLVLPLAGVPAGVTPAFAAAALAPGVGVALVSVDDGVVDGMDEVDGVVAAGVDDDEGVAPVSSTFLPQAPSASKAANATAVAAAGLNLDASMSVSFYKSDER